LSSGAARVVAPLRKKKRVKPRTKTKLCAQVVIKIMHIAQVQNKKTTTIYKKKISSNPNPQAG
jgi:hypothetical protein